MAGSTGSDGHFLARKACEERRKRSPERGRKREDNKTGVGSSVTAAKNYRMYLCV